jgi:hypothetical protein
MAWGWPLVKKTKNLLGKKMQCLSMWNEHTRFSWSRVEGQRDPRNVIVSLFRYFFFYLLAIILFNQGVETYLAHHGGSFSRSISLKIMLPNYMIPLLDSLHFFLSQILFKVTNLHELFFPLFFSDFNIHMSFWHYSNFKDYCYSFKMVYSWIMWAMILKYRWSCCLKTRNDYFTNFHKEIQRLFHGRVKNFTSKY